MMQYDPDYQCHMTGFKKNCRDLRDKCPKWVFIEGEHPQSGEIIRQFDCADTWNPILQVRISKEVRELAAAIESFRNEMVRLNNIGLRLTAMNIQEQRNKNGDAECHLPVVQETIPKA